MIDSTIANDRSRREAAAMESFLESPNEESFTELFLTLTPQLVCFFRSHGCGMELSEDLSQEVMLTVYRKASQLRDRTRFRAWRMCQGFRVNAVPSFIGRFCFNCPGRVAFVRASGC